MSGERSWSVGDAAWAPSAVLGWRPCSISYVFRSAASAGVVLVRYNDRGPSRSGRWPGQELLPRDPGLLGSDRPAPAIKPKRIRGSRKEVGAPR